MNLTTRTEVIRADDLARNSRVILDLDDRPFLVDSVEDTADGTLRVTFSSGDVLDYRPGAPVVVPA